MKKALLGLFLFSVPMFLVSMNSQASNLSDLTVQNVLNANHGTQFGFDLNEPELLCAVKVSFPGEFAPKDTWITLSTRVGEPGAAYPGVGGWTLDAANSTMTFYFDNTLRSYMSFTFNPSTLKLVESFDHFDENFAHCKF